MHCATMIICLIPLAGCRFTSQGPCCCRHGEQHSRWPNSPWRGIIPGIAPQQQGAGVQYAGAHVWCGCYIETEDWMSSCRLGHHSLASAWYLSNGLLTSRIAVFSAQAEEFPALPGAPRPSGDGEDSSKPDGAANQVLVPNESCPLSCIPSSSTILMLLRA